eukprot:365315-Chlamydomonas_euryale.AAC.4
MRQHSNKSAVSPLSLAPPICVGYRATRRPAERGRRRSLRPSVLPRHPECAGSVLDSAGGTRSSLDALVLAAAPPRRAAAHPRRPRRMT